MALLAHHALRIRRSPTLNDIILQHEKILSDIYKKKPLFYKMLFKHFRFNIASEIFSIYYCLPSPTLKSAKEFIISQKNTTSINTLNSLFTLLSVSGRLEIFKSRDSAGDMLFRPTESVKQEISDLIASLLIPWQTAQRDTSIYLTAEIKSRLPQFFSRYGQFIFQQITLKEALPECGLFIEKDAGHMIMLILYTEYIRQNSARILISPRKIAQYSHVSRSHIDGLLKAAQGAGFLSVENNLFITLSDTFITLFRRYFSLYLAQILYAFDLLPKG